MATNNDAGDLIEAQDFLQPRKRERDVEESIEDDMAMDDMFRTLRQRKEKAKRDLMEKQVNMICDKIRDRIIKDLKVSLLGCKEKKFRSIEADFENLTTAVEQMKKDSEDSHFTEVAKEISENIDINLQKSKSKINSFRTIDGDENDAITKVCDACVGDVKALKTSLEKLVRVSFRDVLGKVISATYESEQEESRIV